MINKERIKDIILALTFRYGPDDGKCPWCTFPRHYRHRCGCEINEILSGDYEIELAKLALKGLAAEKLENALIDIDKGKEPIGNIVERGLSSYRKEIGVENE